MTEKPMAVTRKLAEFIVKTNVSSISDDIYEHAKVAFMDWTAVTLGGKTDSLVEKLIKYSDIMGGNPQATIIGHNIKKSMSHASLINGAMSHALDYDDTLASFLGHPSVTIFPALLALNESEGMSGKDFLAAYIIGMQTGCAVGACAGLEHYMAGWHATSTLGHIASAAACAKLLNLNVEQTLFALGIGGTQASGLKRVFGTMCKPFHAGIASQSGLMAALLARDGFTSAEDIIEGPQGFLEVLQGKVNTDVIDMLGLGWDIIHLSQKYHASCHATHSPLEAALTTVKENNIDLNNIKSIKVYSSELALGAAGKTEPQSGLEGKFSIVYCVANALIRGVTGDQAFTDEMVNDSGVRELMGKIVVEQGADKIGLETNIEIETVDGRMFEGASDILAEIPPLEDKKVRVKAKFFDLAEPVIGREKTLALADNILNLESFKNIDEILKFL